MKCSLSIKKTLSFLLSLITCGVFLSQAYMSPAPNVSAAEDKLELFGVETDLTPKEFVSNIGKYAKAMSGYKYGLTGTRYDSSENTLDCISFVELVYKLAAGTAKGKNSQGSVVQGDSWRTDVKYYKDPANTSPIDISSWTVSAKDVYGLCKPYTHNLRTFRANVLDNGATGVSHTSFTDITEAKFFSNRLIEGVESSNKNESDSAWKSLLKNIKFSDGKQGASNGDIMIFYVNDCTSYSDIALHVGIYYEIDGVPGVYHCSDSKGVTYIKQDGKVSYKVTKDSSTGHYGVRWEALSDGISKDAALTHIAVYKTTEEEYPVNIGFLVNKTLKNYLFTGAEFTVYESDKTTVRGKITDNDGNGVYSNYKDVSGESCLVLGYASSSKTSLKDTFYIQESKSPTDVVTESGTFRAKEDYSDKSLYKVEVSYKTTVSDPSSGTFTYKVSGGNLDSAVSDTISGYSADDSYKDNGNKIRLANNSDDYVKFAESTWLKVTKQTNDGSIYDTKVTKLTLRKKDNTALAHYMYSSEGWGWYLNNGDTYYGPYYPLSIDSDYKITETYTVPVFRCYDGKTIPYKVTNSEWPDNTYSFSTKGKSLGDTISVTCTNNVDSSSFKLSKNVNYGTKEGFEFTLLTQDRSKILAKGISDSKGTVNWKYYGKSGSLTESDTIILPEGTYRLEETVPSGTVTAYGAVMKYEVPQGFMLDESGKYAYRNVKVTGEGYEFIVTNNLDYGSIAGTKSVPSGNAFDPSTVKFSLYYDHNGNGSYDSGESTVSTGTVDGSGKVVFAKDVTHLAFGKYVIRETWTPEVFTYSDGKEEAFVSHNDSGWKKISDTCYEKSLVISKEQSKVSFTAVNYEDSGFFTLTKTFLTEGDTGISEFDLIYKGKVLAKGTARPSGKKGEAVTVTWVYGNNKVTKLKVPAGDYEIREYIPEVFYKKTKVKFTYETPEGWTKSSDGKYFSKKIKVTKDSVTKAAAANTLLKGSLTINKTDESEGKDNTFTFNIYWRGNGKTAADIGKFDKEYLFDTVKVTTKKDKNGEGSFTLSGIPYGYYEISEKVPEGYVLNWNTSDKTGIVHITGPDQASGSLSGTNRINITVTAIKKDKWTGKIIADPDQYSPAAHLKYTLYEDINSNGVLDDNEKKTGRELEDKDNDGTIVFDNTGKGDYLLKETGTIAGYYLSDKIISFSVKKNEDVVLYPEDSPYSAPLKITKSDHDDKTLLSGASFELYVDTNNNLVFDKDDKIAMVMAGEELKKAVISETSEGVYECEGLLHFNDGSKTFGRNYILVEKSAPKGYFFVTDDGFTGDNTVIFFSIDAKDTKIADFKVAPVEYEISNKTGSVTVHKCSDEGVTLKGAVFEVYKDENCKDKVCELAWKEGSYFFKGLGAGKYYLVEAEAPEGYEKDPAVYPFDITFDDPDVTVGNRLGIKYNLEGKFVNCALRTTSRDSIFAEEYELMMSAGNEGSITDRVYYDGLVAGKEYILEGTVLFAQDHSAEDGTQIKAGTEYCSSDGTPFVSRKTFTAGKDGIFTLSEDNLTVEGYIEIDIPCDTSYLSANLVPVVICERLYSKKTKKLVGEHNDIKSVRQTLIPIRIGTLLTASDGISHVVPVSKNAELIDKVELNNLAAGKKYRLDGVLLDTGSGKPYLDRQGNKITSSVAFTVSKDNAVKITEYKYNDEAGNEQSAYLADAAIDVPFTVDTSDLEGRSLTAFEFLYVEEAGEYVKIAEHADPEDRGQTVTCDKKIPKIRTYLTDKASATKTVPYGTKIELTDKITYEGLYPGLEYTLEGLVFDKTSGEDLMYNGRPVSSKVTFVPDEESGTVLMPFVIDSTAIEGHELVAFETLIRGDNILITHNDKADKDQTVVCVKKIPKIKTALAEKTSSFKTLPYSIKVNLIDTISYEGLYPGVKYTMEGTLFDKTADDYLKVNGKKITSKIEFVPDNDKGNAAMPFEIDTTKLEGHEIVAFESLLLNGTVLITHADKNDKDQTVVCEKKTPKIKTYLTDKASATKTVPYGMKIELTDKITYEGLYPGVEYVLEGMVFDKTADETLMYNGKPVSSKVTFAPDKESGTLSMPFVIDSTAIEGHELVAFETLKRGDDILITHNDKADKDQTVVCVKKTPKIRTFLIDKASVTKTVSYGKDIVLEDTISFEGLYPGFEYTMEGILFDKTVGEYLKCNGKTVSSTMKFTPDKECGYVVMRFVIDSSSIAGHDIVAFETLFKDGEEVTSHKDKDDKDQTVTVPSCKTNAVTKDGKKVILSMRKAVIVDTVEYKGLTPGKKYCVVASLYTDKGDKIVNENGGVFESVSYFTPDSKDGTVDVSIEFANKLDVGTVVVVFEEIYLNDRTGTEDDVLVTCHKDLSCKEQSLGVDLPNTGEEVPDYMRIAAMGIMLTAVSVVMDVDDKRRRKRGEEE